MSFDKTIKESKNISGNNFLLAIGVDEYSHFQTSQHRVSELKKLIKILQDKYCFESKYTTVLFDSEASITNIFKHFESLVATLTKNDTLLLLLNGHIVFDKLFRQYFWMPVNALPNNVNQYLPINQFLTLFESFNAFPIYFILDGKIEDKVIKYSFDDLKKENKGSSSRFVLASNQENAVPNFNEESFFLAISKVLKENDSSINASALHTKLKSSIDIPIKGGALELGGKGGQFIFKLRPNEANDWAVARQENTLIAYQKFLLDYPNGNFVKPAIKYSESIKEDIAWERALKENTQQSFLDYKTKYKGGKYSDDADQNIAMVALAAAKGVESNNPKTKKKKVAQKIEKIKPSSWSKMFSRLKPKPTKKIITRKIINQHAPSKLTAQEAFEPTFTKKEKEKEKENSSKYIPQFKKGGNWKKYSKKVIGGLLVLLISLGIYSNYPSISRLFEKDNSDLKGESLNEKLGNSSNKDETIPLKDSIELIYQKELKMALEKYNSRQYLESLSHYKNALKYKPNSYFAKTWVNTLTPCKNIPPFQSIICRLIVDMVQISGGTFEMGSQSGDLDERPLHQVSISNFKMGKYEVTQEMYEAVMGENPSSNKRKNLPVTNVSYENVSSFLKKLNKLITGKNFRLPTEAEWEYAARGGKKQMPFLFAGHDEPNIVAIHAKNSKNKLRKVGSKRQNTLGLFDMSGNVAEWCEDKYDENFYKTSQGNNPKNVSKDSNSIIIRGGSYIDVPNDCRNTKRNYKPPSFSASYIGFRCVSD